MMMMMMMMMYVQQIIEVNLIIIIQCINIAQDREKLQMRWVTVKNGTRMS